MGPELLDTLDLTLYRTDGYVTDGLHRIHHRRTRRKERVSLNALRHEPDCFKCRTCWEMRAVDKWFSTARQKDNLAVTPIGTLAWAYTLAHHINELSPLLEPPTETTSRDDHLDNLCAVHHRLSDRRNQYRLPPTHPKLGKALARVDELLGHLDQRIEEACTSAESARWARAHLGLGDGDGDDTPCILTLGQYYRAGGMQDRVIDAYSLWAGSTQARVAILPRVVADAILVSDPLDPYRKAPVATYPLRDTREVIEVAAGMWDPLNEESPLSSFATALDCARHICAATAHASVAVPTLF